MVINIPKSAEFMEASIELLNQAWDIIDDLSSGIRRSYYRDWEEEQVSEYWQTAQPRLRSALALVQQAAEVGLKGRIAAVSPFLLIAGDPDRWPTSTPNGISFAEFRTIDAVDLPKVQDLFSAVALSEAYRNHYERTRKLRNESIHGVSVSERLTDIGLFEDILVHFRNLHDGKRWTAERLAYQSTSPLAALHSSDHAMTFTLLEIDLAVEILPPRVLKQEFGFDKKEGRNYICPDCFNEAGTRDEFANGFVKFAKLEPNTSTSQFVYCFVCNRTSKVHRVDCANTNCTGNVIGDLDGRCLTCGDAN
jgi:hypothetical protein